jgi:hypothetical protein
LRCFTYSLLWFLFETTSRFGGVLLTLADCVPEPTSDVER